MLFLTKKELTNAMLGKLSGRMFTNLLGLNLKLNMKPMRVTRVSSKNGPNGRIRRSNSIKLNCHKGLS